MGIFRRFRTVFGLTALVAIAACSSWRPYQTGSAQFPSAVRVTLESGDRVTLDGAFLHGDTLLYGTPSNQGDLRAFPMRNVELIEARRFSAGKTLLFAVVVLVPTGLVLYGSSLCPGSSNCD